MKRVKLSIRSPLPRTRYPGDAIPQSLSLTQIQINKNGCCHAENFTSAEKLQDCQWKPATQEQAACPTGTLSTRALGGWMTRE